ncbi:phospholipase D family protein [Paraneptunicella aestuarii]|uniref:phospholipase D-like domain-containing protein n=1 Tax=Paraneptunicella aestuarii TaxID=2831148 RepID=UPI001E4A6B0A|nr:phospholipase D family protein [Paraneptunicella aestuarii]UAA39061.1 phospholipase D family protein [Paraneptunicella aestuarii]
MAKVFALTQGLAPNHDHEYAINNLIDSPWANDLFISVAFVKEAGVSKIEAALHRQNNIAQVFVGISNGITSKQALAKLLAIGVHPYVIDMGTQASLFHPKLYAAIGDQQATVIVGSANLTGRGLSGNVEVSTKVELDLTEHDDSQYVSTLVDPFRALIGQYPLNVFQITTGNQLDDLVSEGRLEDESVKKGASVTGTKSPGGRSVAIPSLPIHRRKPQALPQLLPVQVAPNPQNPQVAPVTGLVWASKELTERDLNIPTGSNTNATGSMYLKKGLFGGIDQRHYFKDIVFAGLTWTPDARLSKRHLLRATANFEIIINGISNGYYNLRLTHNSKTDTPTYKENNSMTQIHWGTAKAIIAQRGLLGKHMALYYLGDSNYQIEIT